MANERASRFETYVDVRREIHARSGVAIGSYNVFRYEGRSDGFTVQVTDAGYVLTELTAREISHRTWQLLRIEEERLRADGRDYLERADRWKNRTRAEYERLAATRFAEADAIAERRNAIYREQCELAESSWFADRYGVVHQAIVNAHANAEMAATWLANRASHTEAA